MQIFTPLSLKTTKSQKFTCTLLYSFYVAPRKQPDNPVFNSRVQSLNHYLSVHEAQGQAAPLGPGWWDASLPADMSQVLTENRQAV